MKQQKRRGIIYLQASVSEIAGAEREGQRKSEWRGVKGSGATAVGTVVKADNTLSMFYEYKK